MSSDKARTALQHVVLGLVLVGIVVLCTVCFNVLGAFGCSILMGMMLGARRQWKWDMIPVSLIFPAVTLSLLEFAKGDIVPQKRILLALICWAAFVITYLLAYLLVRLEGPGQSASSPIDSQLETSEGAYSAANKSPDAALASLSAPLTLTLLEGHWSSEGTPPNGQKRILQVAGDELVLRITDATGQVTCHAKGRVRLE